MPRLVVDASVAVKWLNASEPLADRAIAIRDDYEQGNISLLVPAFWDYEVANAMNKAVARGEVFTIAGTCCLPKKQVVSLDG